MEIGYHSPAVEALRLQAEKRRLLQALAETRERLDSEVRRSFPASLSVNASRLLGEMQTQQQQIATLDKRLVELMLEDKRTAEKTMGKARQ